MEQFIQLLITNNQSLIFLFAGVIAFICLIWFIVAYKSIRLEVVNPATNNLQALKLKEDLSKKTKEIERLKHRFENQQKKMQEVGDSESTEAVDALKKEVEELKGKLFDYEIIEDDLADLTKFKEENALLMEKLSKFENNSPKSDPQPVAKAEPKPVAEPESKT